ncbi:B-cell receptor-associated protein 31 [Halotydeus destructor]|nr:B-cell receptor-associated protein 31 [Halotydeus destructor]
MSVQWFLVANVLYAEIAFTALLLLPIVSPKTWRKLFKSKFRQRLGHANFYSTGFVIILIVLFFDSIREMRKPISF